MKRKVIFIAIFCVIAIVCMIFSPSRFVSAASNGTLVFATAVFPSLFPFIFFTKLLFSIEADKVLAKIFASPMRKIFGVRGEASFVFVSSLFSGYPVGSKSAYDLSEKVPLTKNEACRIASFCSNSGPMFIFGTIGAILLKSQTAGIIIFVSHIIGSFLNGILFSHFKINNGETISKNTNSFKQDSSLQNIMFSSISSALAIGGYITIFFIVCEIFSFLSVDTFLTNIFSSFVNPQVLKSLLYGFLEVTRGCFELSTSSLTLASKTIFSTFLVSFGGISIALQSLSYLTKLNVPAWFYLFSKLSHALLSTLISILLCFLFL
ncbi:MAG: hypothetical protein WCR30_02325 [Clostridia bacterium]